MVIDQNGKKYYKVGLHIHSSRSDGDESPERVVQIYKEHGYDAIALTDHWKVSENGMQDGMLMLAGCEYNNQGHDAVSGVTHILGLGMQYDPQVSREDPRQTVVDKIIAAGGLAVLAHPAWSMNTLKDARELKGIFTTEMYNAVSEAHMSVRPISDYFVDICANNGIYYNLLATDDAHYYDGSDECKGWVMVQAEELTHEALMQALREGNYYASTGPEMSVTRQGNKLIVDCSPCKYVAALSNLAWARYRVLRGDAVTHYEYEFKDNEPWVRIQAMDANGKFAWSNIFMRE